MSPADTSWEATLLDADRPRGEFTRRLELTRRFRLAPHADQMGAEATLVNR